MNPLCVENLTKRFAADHPPAVDDLSFELHPGEVLALLGPSGCGKTTALRIIGGFERPEAGKVFLHGRLVEGPSVHVPPEKRGVGLVFQDMALFPHRDVLHNVMFGLQELPRSQRQGRAMEVLAMVGLADLALRRPHELSGGQQQRVALARSLAPAPPLILLDEPFNSLDPDLRQATRRQVRQVLAAAGTSALLVTHDQEEALTFADRIGVMRQGRLCQIGAPEAIYKSPACAFVANFLGSTNLIRAQASGGQAATPMGPICLSQPVQGQVLISVRPEHLRPVAPQAGRPVGCVVGRDFKGHDLTLTVSFGQEQFTLQTDYTCPFGVGSMVSIVHVEPAVVIPGSG